MVHYRIGLIIEIIHTAFTGQMSGHFIAVKIFLKFLSAFLTLSQLSIDPSANVIPPLINLYLVVAVA